MTLNDLLTSKEIGAIYSSWRNFLLNMSTVGWIIHELLIGKHLWCNSTEWPWHLTFDLKRNRGHLLTMTNLRTKYEDCRLNDTRVIDLKPFMMLQYWMTLTFDLLTSKEIEVIYSPWQSFLPNTRTVHWMIHKLLIGNHLVFNSTEWPWPLTFWPQKK